MQVNEISFSLDMNGFAPSLALRKRFKENRKWPIGEHTEALYFLSYNLAQLLLNVPDCERFPKGFHWLSCKVTAHLHIDLLFHCFVQPGTQCNVCFITKICLSYRQYKF